MGINRTKIDLGNTELRGRGNVKALAPTEKGESWEAETVDFKFGLSSQKKTPYIEVTYKIVDPDAVDIDGEPYKGKVWDNIWFTDKAAAIVKSKLEALGYDTSELVVESDDDIAEIAADLKADFTQVPVRLVTNTREDETGKTYKDGTPKQYVDVVFVNEA